MQQKIRNKFQELFSTKGSVYASPGRINLIGEHTDYNGGFVFPGAIDKGMIAEIKAKKRFFDKRADFKAFPAFSKAFLEMPKKKTVSKEKDFDIAGKKLG